MTPTYSSSYPNGNLASDIVGYTTVNSTTGDLQGVGGLEAEFNSVLKGRDGRQDVEVGTDGEPIPMTQVKTTPVVGGRSLRLTINANIQFAAEQECQRRVAMFHARNCSIIVMDPQTGAILAMAQWPTETLADFQQTGATSNISTNDVFAPGSTLKSITVAAALEKGHQTPMNAYTIPYSITCRPLPYSSTTPSRTRRSATPWPASSRTRATWAWCRWSSTSRPCSSTTTCARSGSGRRAA